MVRQPACSNWFSALFVVRGELRLQAVRQDPPPKLTLIRCEIIMDSAGPDQRLDLLHRIILKYGTISNTLVGRCRCRAACAAPQRLADG